MPFVRAFQPSSLACLLSRASFVQSDAHCSERNSPEPVSGKDHYVLNSSQICLVGLKKCFLGGLKPGPVLKRNNKTGHCQKSTFHRNVFRVRSKKKLPYHLLLAVVPPTRASIHWTRAQFCLSTPKTLRNQSFRPHLPWTATV